MSRPRFVRSSARFLLVVFLFAQGALAFAGCDMPERTPAAAIAVSGLPCHEPTGEANLCLVHCLAADQSLDKPDVTVHPLVAIPVLAVRGAADFEYVSLAPRRLGVPPAVAPPARILFRTLRI
jgi:hypothetical protein